MRKIIAVAGLLTVLTAPAGAAVTYSSASVTLTSPFTIGPANPAAPSQPMTSVNMPKINLGALDVLDSVTVSALFHSDNFFSI